ncbi:hypothetical protein CPB84DRAFT_1749994 [Gymnopilus junonius]|uniref:Uncharacterized protein n=1 Tax=Gymnopilus junonius TaxID=109634 RepID=A0A9P5TJU8_GYMJU|nr:hypothetical protein CPB84DRAFT_1749994 [Gymnopilus junonius]
MSSLYHCLDAPSLNRFDYQSYDHMSSFSPNVDGTDAPTSPVHALIERSSLMTKLSFDPQMLSSQDIIFCFRLASQLTHLILGKKPRHFISPLQYVSWTGGNDSNFNLNALIIEGDSEILLPRLEVFEAYLSPNKFSDHKLKTFILSRLGESAAQKGVSSLRSVRVVFGREMETDISTEIYRCAEEERVEIELDLQYIERLPANDYSNILSPWYVIIKIYDPCKLPCVLGAKIIGISRQYKLDDPEYAVECSQASCQQR